MVNFRNTVIILTSNIGARYIDKMEKIGFASDQSEKANYADAKTKVLEALKDHFRPEFLNRLDDMIVFDILSKEAIKQIVGIQVDIVKARLAQKEVKLAVSSSVIDYLAKEGYSPQYGARPLKRLIQSKILTPIAGLMISKGLSKGGTISVDMKGGEFSFSVKKGKNGSFVSDSFINESALA